jgi:heat-inducible transcriptional repressor
MLHYPEYSDVNKAKTFLAAVEGRNLLYDMLKRASKLEFSITIGNENEDEMFKDCSIVTATYQVGDEPLGSFGIIGPTRMNYGKVISVLEYMRRSLSEVLSADQDDE